MLWRMFRLKIGNALIKIKLLREQDCEFDESLPTTDELSVLTLQAIKTLGETIMSQIDDLKTAITEQSAALEGAKQRISDDVTRLENELADALAEKPELAEVLAGIRQTTQELTTLDPVKDQLPDGGEVTPPTDTPPTDTTGGDNAGGDVTPPADGGDTGTGTDSGTTEPTDPGTGTDVGGDTGTGDTTGTDVGAEGDAGPVTDTTNTEDTTNF